MRAITRILAVLDADDPQQLALKRARLFAEVIGAHLHLLVCDRHNDHSQRLTELKKQLHDEGCNATAEQAWDHSEHETIINVQQAERCDLVVKRQRPSDNPLVHALLTPLDWKLIRHCPSAVLLVKSERRWLNGNVLCAVDIGNDEVEHRLLHRDLIARSRGIAELAHGNLHVVCAQTRRDNDALDAFQREFGIESNRLHVAQAPADSWIPGTARDLDAVLTVIGTVARSGISGALVGNTAEAVLDNLECDVMILKTEEVIRHLAELARS